jgi:hypothetical protein
MTVQPCNKEARDRQKEHHDAESKADLDLTFSFREERQPR